MHARKAYAPFAVLELVGECCREGVCVGMFGSIVRLFACWLIGLGRRYVALLLD